VGGRFIPGIGWLGLDPSHGILTGILIFQLLQVRTSRIRCQFRAVFEVAIINPTFNRKTEVGSNPFYLYNKIKFMKIFQCGHCAQPYFLKATLVKIVAIYQR
jgi:hypothetical protein